MLARSIGSDVSSATAAGYSILPARQSVNQPFQAEWPNGAVVTSTESTHDGGLNEPARTLLNSAAMAAVCPSRCHRPAGGLWPTRALNDPGTIVRMAPSNMPRHQSVPLSKGRAARWQVKSTPGTPLAHAADGATGDEQSARQRWLAEQRAQPGRREANLSARSAGIRSIVHCSGAQTGSTAATH